MNSTISRPRKMLVAFIERPFLASPAPEVPEQTTHSLEKPKMGELQMDWLRSEDLKEEKNVTAPTVIIAVWEVCRALAMTIGCEAYH
jgi:hypothetical protein